MRDVLARMHFIAKNVVDQHFIGRFIYLFNSVYFVKIILNILQLDLTIFI